MALSGTLKDFGIADILQLIGQQQKTGTLHLKARDQEVQVAFVEGNIVKAESTTRKKKDLIGSMLVRAELITDTQLEAALDTQRRTLKRLGDVLVSSRMITAERFAGMVKLQTTETLYKLFSWKTGTYQFVQGEVEFDPAAGIRIRAESVLMEGFRMVDEWPVVKRTITSYELTFEQVQQLPAPPTAIATDNVEAALDDAFGEAKPVDAKGDFKSIGRNERRIYAFATPGRDVRKLIDLGCLGEFETCKALLNLVNLGYLKTVAPMGRTNEVGAAPTGLMSQAALAAARLGVTVFVLGLFAVVALNANLDALSLGSSPSSYADPAAERAISRTQLSRIEAALTVYRAEKGEWPDKLEGLVESGLLARHDIRYPWRDAYYYRRTADSFVLLPPLR